MLPRIAPVLIIFTSSSFANHTAVTNPDYLCPVPEIIGVTCIAALREGRLTFPDWTGFEGHASPASR